MRAAGRSGVRRLLERKEQPVFGLNLDLQEYISESLMAEGWQPRRMVSPIRPGSKWVLIGPRLRGRLVMTSDRHSGSAWLSSVRVVRPGHLTVPNWQTLVSCASSGMVLAMARVAEIVPDNEPIAWSRLRLNRRLRALGWQRSSGWPRSLVEVRTEWTSSTGAYQLVVPSRRDRRIGGAKMTGPDVLVGLAESTPVGVVAALADAVAARRMIGAGEGPR